MAEDMPTDGFMAGEFQIPPPAFVMDSYHPPPPLVGPQASALENALMQNLSRGLAKANQTLADGMGIATGAAAGGMMAASQSVAGGMARASQLMSGPVGGAGGMVGGIVGGKTGQWLASARYDNPAGGDIDTFHNRLCFDQVCRHDPEMTQDLSTEWLRRAIPMRDYPHIPSPKPLHAIVPKPHQLYSLVPYQDAAKGGTCAREVHMHDTIELETASAPAHPLVLINLRRPNSISNFIYV